MSLGKLWKGGLYHLPIKTVQGNVENLKLFFEVINSRYIEIVSAGIWYNYYTDYKFSWTLYWRK